MLQVPALQVLGPVGIPHVPHCWPQAPQLLGSVCKSTQAPAAGQKICKELHVPPVQRPFVQVVPPPQTCPQAPQLLGSEVVLTHAPLQAVRPDPETQTSALLIHVPL